ncbi:MAG: hypothetical protein EDM05_018280 [Leptolyngbya sp. IPPAS B-1204]
MSNRPDLSRISFVSDVFLPDNDLWVSDYPYVRKDVFMDVSRRLGQQSDGWRGEDNLDDEPRRRIRKF